MATTTFARRLTPLLLALCCASATAQYDAPRDGFPRIDGPQAGAPIPYGEELDWNPRPMVVVPGISSSGFPGGLTEQPLQHGAYCCEEFRAREEQRPQPQPRTGPQYDYQNIGEPWDSHARLLRARDERRDAERNVDQRRDEHRQSAHNRDVDEMYPGQWGPDPLDEYGQEVDQEYLHTRHNRDSAEDRLDRAVAEERAAQAGNDAAVTESEQWQADQPHREYPPYEGRPVAAVEHTPTSQGDRERQAENAARERYYETINRHADGDASIEEVEAAYRHLRASAPQQ